jgi:hypothetical protein
VIDLLDSTPNGSMGLCTTCNNIPECGYREARGFDAIFCELFDTYTVPSARAFDSDPESSPDTPEDKKGKKRTHRPRSRSNDEESQNNLKGLCINCEHRTDCCLPRPDGGVWHCEEYE